MLPALTDALRHKGVIVHAPDATVIEDIGADAFEPGVEIYPAVTIRGAHSRFGAKTQLGKAGGGYFENVVTGRDVELYGGYFKDCALLDGVTMRGHAEIRGGTVLEEGCEGAHHVGYKMTVMLPWVIAGSLVNFCDVLMGGGHDRSHHSEIGSSLALYNYTPWGDKHASLFGDVPRGVFLREAPIFIGGSTQIVSPVDIGFGAVVPAGFAVRKDIPAGRLYGEPPAAIDKEFARDELGVVGPKIHKALRYLGNIVALQTWYRYMRIPSAGDDAHLLALYAHAQRQLNAQVAERIKRAKILLGRLDESLIAHERALKARREGLSFKQRYRRIDDHKKLLAQRDAILAHLNRIGDNAFMRHRSEAWPLIHIAEAFREHAEPSLPRWLSNDMDVSLIEPAQHLLQTILDEVSDPPLPAPNPDASS